MADILIAISGDASRLVAASGQATTALGAVDAAAGKAGAGISGIEASTARAAGGLSGLVGIASTVTSALSGIGLAAAGIRTIADTAIGAGKALGLGLTAELETTRAQFMAFTKSAAETDKMLALVRAEADKTPFSFAEMSKAMAGLMPAAKQAQVPIMDLLKTAEVLAASNPAQGLEGAAFALREAVSGDFTSVIERFNLPRSYINKLKDEGVPALEAVRRAMLEMGYDADLVSNIANTMAGRWSTFMDSVDGARIALSQPLFDVLSTSLVGLQGAFDDNKETVMGWATAIGQGIGTVASEAIRQLGDAGRTIAQVFSDGWLPSDEIDPFVNGVGVAATAVRDFSRWVTGLPEPVKAAGLAFAGVVAAAGPLSAILGAVTGAVGVVGAAVAFLVSPLGLAALAVAGLAAAWTVNLGGIQEKTAEFTEIVGRYFGGFVILVQQALAGDVASAFENLKTMVGMMAGELQPLLAAWGAEFVNWITVAAPPMLAAAAQLGTDLLTWIGAQIPPITAQLLAWGHEFVAWVAPMVPPLLAAAGALASDLLTWAGSQVAPITAQLLLWGAEFVAWVAPQIPPLLSALAGLYVQVQDWMIAQIPGITAELVKWGLLFGAWVLTTAVPELLKALPGILTTIGGWALQAAVEIPKLLLTVGAALVTGIWDGFTQAWATIGPRIMEAIRGAFVMPTLRSGSTQGGIPGLETQSYSSGGDYQQFAAERARQYGIPEAVFLAQLNQESGWNPTARSRAGAAGIAQFMPGTAAQYGVNVDDPYSSIDGAARHMRDLLDANDGDIGRALAGYNAGQGAVNQYGGIPPYAETQKYVRNILGAASAGMPKMPLGMSLPGGLPGSDPTRLPLLLQQVIDVAPDWQTAMAQIQQSGVTTFTTVETAGTTASTSLVTSSTDAMGNVTRIYSEGGAVVGATITDAAGVVVNAWGTMSASVVEQSGTMVAGVGVANATLVSTSTDALGNVTTIYTDAAGLMTATITDASGNVVNQFGVMQDGAVTAAGAMQVGTMAAVDLMASGALTSVTAMHDGTLTTVQNMSGTTIATVTDMQGRVVEQSATLANGVSLNINDMAVKSTSTVDEMAGTITTVMTDTAGNSVTTVTDMAGRVVSQFTTVKKGAEDVVPAVKGMGDSWKNLPTPNVSGIVSAFKKISDAADDALSSVDKLADKTGVASGSGKSNPFGKRAAGGPVSRGVGYIVGEIGPELFVPATDGTIIPNNQMRGVTGVNPYSPTGVTADGISGDFGRYIVEDITRLTNERADAILDGLTLLHEDSETLSLTIMSTSGGVVTAVGNAAGAVLAALNTIARVIERVATEVAKLPNLLTQINSGIGRIGSTGGTTRPTTPAPTPVPVPVGPVRGVTPGPGMGTPRPVTPPPDPTRGVTPGPGGTRSVRGDSVFEGVISSSAQMYQQVVGNTVNMRNVSTANIETMARSVTSSADRMGDDVGSILTGLEEDSFDAFIRKAQDADDALFTMAGNITDYVRGMSADIGVVFGALGTDMADDLATAQVKAVGAADVLANAVVFKFGTMRPGTKQQIDLLGTDMATALNAITATTGSGPVKSAYELGAEVTKQVGKAISDRKKTDIVDKLVAAVEDAVKDAKKAAEKEAGGSRSSSSLVATPGGSRTASASDGPGVAELIAEVRSLKATIASARSVSVTYSESGPPPSLMHDVSILESLAGSGT